MPDAAIAFDGVVRRFGDVTALDHLDLRVARGEVVGLLGHNGAGKTTAVRTVAGLLAPDEGTVRVGGLDPVADGPTVRARLGVLPAQPVVDPRLTARGNLGFAAEVAGLPRDGLAARLDAALARFDLLDRAEERVAGFSTGMRQRLSLARVLLPDPEVLLLDEPTSALDPVAARAVRELLAELATTGDRTVVVCTHDLAEAEQLCDRVVVLERGRAVADGSPQELAARHGAGGLRVTVAEGDVARAAAVVTEVLGAEPVRQDAAVLVHAVEPDEVPALVRALVGAGLDVHEVRRLVPTLEEVYLALHAPDAARPPVPGVAS